MERGRKWKVITIITLVVAIVTMSLGFAIFSNVLTISSSATVKPNAEDYIVNIYGVAEEIPEDALSSGDLSAAVSYFTSKTTSVPVPPIIFGNTDFLMAYDSLPAIIDNRDFTISNLNVIFSNKGQGTAYAFIIKNEGKKSVYINFDKMEYGNKTCVATGETTQSLVDEDCDKISRDVLVFSSSGEPIYLGPLGGVSSYEVVSGDFVVWLFMMTSGNQELVVDGEFRVEFDDIQLEFSSVNNG